MTKNALDFRGGLTFTSRNKAVRYPEAFLNLVALRFGNPPIVPVTGYDGPVVRCPNGAVFRLAERCTSLRDVDFSAVDYWVIKEPTDLTQPPFVRDTPAEDTRISYPYVWVATGTTAEPHELLWTGANRRAIMAAARNAVSVTGKGCDFAVRNSRGSNTWVVMPRAPWDTDQSMRISSLREYACWLFTWAAKSGLAVTLPVPPRVAKQQFASWCNANPEMGDACKTTLAKFYPDNVLVSTFTVVERGWDEARVRRRSVPRPKTKLKPKPPADPNAVKRPRGRPRKEVKQQPLNQVAALPVEPLVEPGTFALPKGFVDESAYVPPPKAAERLARMNPELPKELTEEDLQRIEQQKEIAKKEWERYAALARGSSPPE